MAHSLLPLLSPPRCRLPEDRRVSKLYILKSLTHPLRFAVARLTGSVNFSTKKCRQQRSIL